MATMIKVTDIHTHYGKVHVLKGISLEVKEGELVTVIGANGAGKTTLLKTLSGILRVSSGEIEYAGKNMKGLSVTQFVKSGICMVPEGRHIFPRMTVWENLMLGAYTRNDKEGIQRDLEYVYSYFPILKDRGNELAGNFSGGQQQMLVIGRALMGNPKLLLLDEPSLGLAPLIVKDIFRILVELNKSGTTIILVEQNAKIALEVAERAYVLETGVINLQGLSSELKNSKVVQEAYLGA